MTFRVPRWVKVTGSSLVAFVLLAVAVVPTDRFKRWFKSQWMVPHGFFGWLFTKWESLLDVYVYDVYPTAAELLQLQPDDELVDVGCESGTFLDKQAAHVNRVAGLAVTGIETKLARKRLADRIAMGTAEIVQGDPAALPWGDNTFTAAACVDGTLLSFPNPDGALAEMYRVLQPGGRLVVDIGIDETDEACVKECDWWGIPHPPEEEARKMVENAGFFLVSISYLDHGYLARFFEATKPE